VLGVFSIYSLFYVRRDKYFLKAYVRRFHDSSKAAGLLCLMRFAMTEAIGIYGLLLGILGAEWYITLPFFIVSGIFMIFYFPTSRKWNKLLEAAETITISNKGV
jgi:hypothetical protein